jgi:hypothetical protein
VKKEIEEINTRAAASSREMVSPVFQPGEQIPEFRAG